MGVGLYILREVRFFADFVKDKSGIATSVKGSFKIPHSNASVGDESPMRMQMEDLFSVRQAVAYMNNADFMEEWLENAHLLEFGFMGKDVKEKIPAKLIEVLRTQCDLALDEGAWHLFRVSPEDPPVEDFETLRQKLKNEERLQRLVFSKASDFYTVDYVFKFF